MLLTSIQVYSQTATSVKVKDTRDVVYAPTEYNNEVRFEFKRRSTISVPGSGNYSGLFTVAPWGDNSGSRSHQLNFNDGGLFYRNGWPDGETWAGWRKLLILDENNRLGIGTGSPSSLIHVYDKDLTADYPSLTSRGDVIQLYEVINNSFEFGLAGASNTRRAWILSRHSDLSGQYGMHYNTLHLQPDIGDKRYYKGVAIGFPADLHLSNGTHLAIDGNVGIGTTAPKYKLDVLGTIRARELKVDMLGADFVFEEDYPLRPISELEDFVKANKHLPEIAPAKEMQENGVNQSEMNQKLLQKIEELTLHIIALNKRLEKVESK